MAKEKEEVNELEDIDVLEISLVGKPANRQRWLIVKHEEGITMAVTDEMLDLLEEAFEGDVPAEVTKALEAIEKMQISGKAADAAKMALRLLGKYKDEVGLKEVVAQLVKLVGSEKMDEDKDKMHEYGYPEPKEDDKVKKSEVAAEVDVQMQALLKAQEDLRKEVELAKSEAARERDLRLQREYVEKAQGMMGIPVPVEELGGMLKALADADQALYAKFETLLAAASNAIRKSDLLKEFGYSEGARVPASATDELMKKANELIQKGEGKLNFGQAVAEVERVAPELYMRYMAEARGKSA